MVTLYTKTDCNPCKLIKAKFSREGVPFEERNVETDPEAMKAVQEMGYLGVPVVVLPDGEHFQGIQPDKLAKVAA